MNISHPTLVSFWCSVVPHHWAQLHNVIWYWTSIERWGEHVYPHHPTASFIQKAKLQTVSIWVRDLRQVDRDLSSPVMCTLNLLPSVSEITSLQIDSHWEGQRFVRCMSARSLLSSPWKSLLPSCWVTCPLEDYVLFTARHSHPHNSFWFSLSQNQGNSHAIIT